MSIGTEIDAHRAPADYAADKVFFEVARNNAKSQWGAALPVGTAVTWGSLTTPGPEQAAILDLDEHADHVLTTYYGINADLTIKDPMRDRSRTSKHALYGPAYLEALYLERTIKMPMIAVSAPLATQPLRWEGYDQLLGARSVQVLPECARPRGGRHSR